MTDVHPLVQGLVVELPPSDGGWWTRKNRDDWMSLLEKVIDFLYDVEEPKQITAASESTIDTIRELLDQAPADVTGPELAEQIRQATAGKHRPPWEGWAPPPPDPRTPPPLPESAPSSEVEEQEAPAWLQEPPTVVPAPDPLPARMDTSPELQKAAADLAAELLVTQHQALAKRIARSYFAPGLEAADLEQEAMIALDVAAHEYDPFVSDSFEAFAGLVISRRIKSAVSAARRQKHAVLNESARLEQPHGEEDGGTLADVVADTTSRDPAEIVITKEELAHLTEIVNTRLSELERDVVTRRANGFSYAAISDQLGQDVKTIDNALQRARDKLSQPLAAAPAKPTPPPAAAEPRRRAKTGGVPAFTITHAQVDELGTRITKRQEEICRLIADGTSTTAIASQLDITISAVHKATLRVRAAMNGRTPAPHVEPVRPVVTDTVPCRIAGCPNQAPRRGRNAGRCKDHRGHALPTSAPLDAAPSGDGAGTPKAERTTLTAPPESPPLPPRSVTDPYLTTAYCDYCKQNMSQRHVDQHALDVERERARQEGERQKISRLSKPTGVGGAA
jgi:RNA polymerase sporulation-specific sigma factor